MPLRYSFHKVGLATRKVVVCGQYNEHRNNRFHHQLYLGIPLVYILLVTVTECARGSEIQIQAISYYNSQKNPQTRIENSHTTLTWIKCRLVIYKV